MKEYKGKTVRTLKQIDSEAVHQDMEVSIKRFLDPTNPEPLNGFCMVDKDADENHTDYDILIHFEDGIVHCDFGPAVIKFEDDKVIEEKHVLHGFFRTPDEYRVESRRDKVEKLVHE
jgi:hypothetical protein